MTTTEQLLDQALSHVAAAAQAMLEVSESDATGMQLIFTTSQCFDVQTLLEDAGAVIDIDVVDQGGTRTPHELLQLAAAALDAIPADEREYCSSKATALI